MPPIDNKKEHEDIIKWYAWILVTSSILVGSGIHTVVYSWYYFIPEGSSLYLPDFLLLMYMVPAILYACFDYLILPYSIYTKLFKNSKERLMDWIWNFEVVMIVWILNAIILAGALSFIMYWYDCHNVSDQACQHEAIYTRYIDSQFFNGLLLTAVSFIHSIFWSKLYVTVHNIRQETSKAK